MTRPLLNPRALAIALFLLIPLAARAALPGGDDPKAYTLHDVLRARVGYYQRTLTGAYNNVGTHDPKWDAAAVKFLDAMAPYLTYREEKPLYQPADLATAAQLRQLAKVLWDAGCTDPLVRYCHSILLLDMDDDRRGMYMLEDNLRPLAKHKYPPFWVADAAGRFAQRAGGLREYETLAWDNALAAADNVPASELRDAFGAILGVFDHLSVPRQGEFCKALAARKDASPWLVDLFSGRYETRAAWASRRGGRANTGTDDGSKGFYDHLTKARDHLVKAYESHPEHPQAANEMITVALGAGDRLNTTPREWFDKTVKAQLDYEGAYINYRYAMLPRWGGGYPEMFAFGLECLRTARFDTSVPLELWNTIQDIDHDDTGDLALLQVPEVQVALADLFTGMANKARGKDHPEFYRSMLAAIQWRAGRFPAAAATLDKLGDRLDPDAFTRVQVWAPAAVSEVRAMTSPHAPALAQARAAEQSGDADAALAAYARAAAKIGADHPGSLFVNSRINALKLQRQFATGQWVNLTPADPASPWAPVGGHWDREKDGTVVARSDARGRAAFLCLADFGPAFEFRARLHRTDPKLDSIPVLLVQWRTDEAFHCGGIVTGTSSAYARGSDRIVNHKFKYKGGELVTVRVQNEAMTVLVDDKPVIENLVANDPPPGARNCVGLGIYGQEPNLTAKFTDVQIRRLDSDKKED